MDCFSRYKFDSKISFKNYYQLFVEVLACDSDPCLNNGACLPHDDGFICNCVGTFYTGDICDES